MNDANFARWVKGPEIDVSVPETEALWWRAQLRKQLADEERATRPVRIAERFAFTACLMTAAAIAAILAR